MYQTITYRLTIICLRRRLICTVSQREAIDFTILFTTNQNRETLNDNSQLTQTYVYLNYLLNYPCLSTNVKSTKKTILFHNIPLTY